MGHKAKSSGSGKAEDPKGGKKDGKKEGKKPAKDSKDGKKSTSKQQVYDYRPSGSADVFAQFAPYEERFVTLDDAEVQLALQALQKKDPTTRLRNVAELHQLLSTRPKSLLSDVCGPFLHTYLRLWPQDSEPGVREGLQRCLQVLVESLQRDFAKHLRSAFPTWLCAMFDTYTEVAQAARTAFAAAFASDEKRRNVFRHSLKECLELLTFYLRHNEQSLHEELGITRTKDKDLSLERQDRYARVLAASLSALGELVHVCAPKGGAVEGASGSLTSEQLQPFVEAGSSVGVWSRLNHKQPTAVRRAAVHCLVRILRCEAEMGLPCATAANRAAAMHVLADEAIPPSSACAMIMAFAAAGEPNDCWEGLDANKAFIQLHMLLQRAKSGVPAEAADFLTRFQELIQVFPQSAWLPGKAELLLKELVEALAMPRGAFLTSASAAWRAYFAICRTSPTVDRQWRWHPVMLFLSQRVETEEREETERMSLPEVSLTRPVLGALPKALQEELPLMPVEAVPELLEILKNSAPMLEAGGSEASCSGGGKSMWRAWVQLLQQLKSQDDASSATAELLRHQLRRLFLVLFTTDVACVFEEALEALSVLLCCDEVFREDLEDKELQEALANSASSTGVEDLNFEWPPEARLLQWPLLPWWCSLMNAKAEAAEPVGRKLVQPILEILGRRLEEEVREGLRESLLKVLLSSSNEVAFSLRLCLECFSSEFHTVESLQVQQALQQLVEQIASGELQPTSLEDALRALYVASSAMATSRCGDWMKVLVSTAESCEPQVQLRLILLVAKVVTELRVEALCEELQQLLEPLCRALLELLIRTEDADAWNMLSKLLKRLDTDQASQLLAERVQIGTGGNWLRLLLEGSSITSLSPLSLLCKARSRDRDGSSHLLPRGAIRPSQLRDSALNAARLLRDERNEDLVLLERQEPVVLEVFWEVLLVVSTGICEEEVAVQGARKIWSFLQDLQTPASTLKRFLHLCIQEVSAENSTWWLDLGCRTMLETLPVVASLQSLAVLRRVLAVCSSSSAGHAVTVAVAEEALNSVQTSGSGHPRAGWGFARAALVPYLSEEKVLALRSQMRLRLLDLCGEKKVTEPVLALAGALELRGAELCAATKTTGETSKAEASAGPLISEVVGASDGANEALDEVHEELDTGLQELLEKLLRWSQSSSSSARSDALANWASSCWVELHCSGTMASRLTRLALETLGVSSPLGSAAAAEPLPVLPGVWRLATALCRHNQWPPERWPPLLASVVAGHVDAADGGDVERRALLSTACTEDAAAAACGVVARAPVGQVEQLAMLLSACDQRLRTAAALRLQEQVWVPAQRSGEPSVAKANEALEKFEELLEAGQTGDLEEEGLGSPDAGRGELPSVSDVSYTVLYAVLGSQMTKTLWSASDALHSLASWEASHRGDDGDEEDSQNHSKWMRAAPGGTEEVGHPATSSSSPPTPQRVGAELPLETIKACVATMAAWETLLAGIDRGLLKGSPAGSSEKAEKAEGSGTGHASPAVLLAALLQLNPDQLAHDHAKVFPAQAAPASPWSSPLQPLLRLLCHLLTSPRLAGFALDEKDTSEALLSAALSQEAPVSYDVLPLAARTLLLALRVAPAAVRSFWEKLPRRRDQSLVEKLISRSFTPLLLQAEVAAATALLEAEASRLPEVEAQVIRRPRQLLLLLAREDLKAELFIQIPASFPLRPAQAEVPEKMPGIPKPRVRNWILQARQVLSGQRPLPVGQAVLMWTRSFALFFKGVKDCPICYNVIQLTTQTIPRKACPTCKNKFHNECLYQWFRTSSKTTCPLCTQPF